MINYAKKLTYVAAEIWGGAVPVKLWTGSMAPPMIYLYAWLTFIGLIQDLRLLPVDRRGHPLAFFKLAAKVFNAVIATVFTDLLYTAAGMCQKKFCLVDSAVDHFVNTCGVKKFFVKFLQGAGA